MYVSCPTTAAFFWLNVAFQILDLHGIHALELNGQTPMRKRKGILDEFRSSTRPKGTRVLILSGVGMVGLNLACANIMLVMVSALLSQGLFS
jgi:SNF2 family DNA or RNA helicase